MTCPSDLLDVIYVTPDFIEISTPQSNYGMKGQLALFNIPSYTSRPNSSRCTPSTSTTSSDGWH